jgi:hypothetical protein
MDYYLTLSPLSQVMRALCDDLNESFLVPVKSPVLQISERGAQVLLECQDGSVFSIPKASAFYCPRGICIAIRYDVLISGSLLTINRTTANFCLSRTPPSRR